MIASNKDEIPSKLSEKGIGRDMKLLLIGGGIGAAIGFLFTPRSGRQVRHSIAEASRAGYDRTVEQALRLKDLSVDAIDRITGKGGEAVDPGSPATRAKAGNVADVRSKHASVGRKPASIF